MIKRMSIATVILMATGLPAAWGLQTFLVNDDFSSDTIASGDWQTQGSVNYVDAEDHVSLGGNMHPVFISGINPLFGGLTSSIAQTFTTGTGGAHFLDFDYRFGFFADQGGGGTEIVNGDEGPQPTIGYRVTGPADALISEWITTTQTDVRTFEPPDEFALEMNTEYTLTFFHEDNLFNGNIPKSETVDSTDYVIGTQFDLDNIKLWTITDDNPDPTVVPAPGAFLLGSLGVGLVGWLRRHNRV